MHTTMKHIPLVDEPLPRPVRWGAAELARLTAMVEQSSLFYWKGTQTAALVAEFRKHYPLEHCFPCSSGTAAIHVAIASLRLRPGEEVITSPITDMGTVVGILFSRGFRSSPILSRRPTTSTRAPSRRPLHQKLVRLSRSTSLGTRVI